MNYSPAGGNHEPFSCGAVICHFDIGRVPYLGEVLHPFAEFLYEIPVVFPFELEAVPPDIQEHVSGVLLQKVSSEDSKCSV